MTSSPTATETYTATYTATSTLTATVTPPVPELWLWFEDRFESNPDTHSVFNGVMQFTHHNGGMALWMLPADLSIQSQFALPQTIAAEAQFTFETGAALLSIRVNGSNNYTARIAADGQVSLIRSGVTIATQTASYNATTGVQATLYSLTNEIGIEIDGVSVITYADATPLTDGQITFASENVGTSGLIIDDFRVWTNDEQETVFEPASYSGSFFVSTPPPNLNPFSTDEGIIAYEDGSVNTSTGFHAVDDVWDGSDNQFSLGSGLSIGDEFRDLQTSPSGRWSLLNCEVTQGFEAGWDLCRVRHAKPSPTGVISFPINRLYIGAFENNFRSPFFNSAGNRVYMRDSFTNNVYWATFNESTGAVGTPQAFSTVKCSNFKPIRNSTLGVCQLLQPNGQIALYDLQTAQNISLTGTINGRNPAGFFDTLTSQIVLAVEAQNCIVGTSCATNFYYLELGETGYIVQPTPPNRLGTLLPNTANGIVGYEDAAFMKNGDYVLITQRTRVTASTCTLRIQIYYIKSTTPVWDVYTNGKSVSCTSANMLNAHTVNTLDFILGYQQFATNTPQPSLDERLATTFPIPMDPSNLTTPPATVPPVRLSDLELAIRSSTTPTPPYLCSRDMNPRGIPAVSGYNIIVPINARVMIIDDTFGSVNYSDNFTTYNSGLGIFLAIRINVEDLPTEIILEINEYLQEEYSPDVIQLENGGYLYIGYAHLQSVEPEIIEAFNNEAGPFITGGNEVQAGTVIAKSGNSDTTLAHLDVTVFYAPPPTSSRNVEPQPSTSGGTDTPGQAQLPRWYNSFYRIFKNQGVYREPRHIDPLALWPLLSEGISDPIDYDCP